MDLNQINLEDAYQLQLHNYDWLGAVIIASIVVFFIGLFSLVAIVRKNSPSSVLLCIGAAITILGVAGFFTFGSIETGVKDDVLTQRNKAEAQELVTKFDQNNWKITNNDAEKITVNLHRSHQENKVEFDLIDKVNNKLYKATAYISEDNYVTIYRNNSACDEVTLLEVA